MTRINLETIDPFDTAAVEAAARELRRREVARMRRNAGAWVRRKVAGLRRDQAHRTA